MRLRQDLQQLGDVAPASGLLSQIQARLSSLFADALSTHTRASDWRSAQALLLDYAGLIDLSVVESGTRQLHTALTAAGESLPAASDAAVSARERRARALMLGGRNNDVYFRRRVAPMHHNEARTS
jgi:hypothetical protein